MTTGKKINWTDQQALAIKTQDRNVLVTASAGTGKTAVLSGRCVDIATDVTLCPSVLNMLVLTFTEAAAEEMRSRIGDRLRDELSRTGQARLARQLVLLQGADISTIHAFCKHLITENFHRLSLDPAFRVIDSDEAMLLKAEVLDETVAWAWEQDHLVDPLQDLLRRRDLREYGGFLRNVIRLNDFLAGVTSPQRWCDTALALAEAGDPLATDLGQAQIQLVGERLDTIAARLTLAYDLHEDHDPGGKWGQALQETLIGPVSAGRDALQAGDWSSCVEVIRRFDKPRAPALKGLPEKLSKLIKDLRTDALSDFVALRDLAVLNPNYLDLVGRSSSVQHRIMIELVNKFGRLYAQKKAALNGLDFSDLEHYALRLLTTEASDDQGIEPSETALALRHRYRFIFVDEYQDINPVQQTILDALSSGDNVFVVGDVKQSIYAFRGAEPTIFINRLKAVTAQGDTQFGLSVDLNRNFRSAKEILDFVNKIFSRIMTASVAHIDYDEKARLQPGLESEPQESSPIVELHILDEGAGGGVEEDLPGLDLVRPCQRQAAMMAQRIREMVDHGDVQYRDIVVLMRSLAKKANDYVEIFRLAGIPVTCDATAGYFETTEISDMLCLLKVLDNPQRDIELVAVLRSPLFSFTETELVTIRLHGREAARSMDFHTCTSQYRDTGLNAELKTKLDMAFKTLDRWRRLARRGRLADLLWQIYRDRKYIAFVCALPNGQARKANLLRLHDRAVQFEGFASSSGVASLTRFVGFIEKLQEAGHDWSSAEPAGATGNAVRIISVHKSKGLEFPVVFLAELESGFNKRDIQDDLIVDVKNTLGLKVVDLQSNSKLRSLAHQVIGEKKRAMMLAEEMRILYVAMTRAKHRLILTASQSAEDCAKVLTKGLLLSDKTIPDWLLKTCNSPLEWVLYALSDQQKLHEAFDTESDESAGDDTVFDLTVHDGDKLRQYSEFVLGLRSQTKAERSAGGESKSQPDAESHELLSVIRKRLSWRYPYLGTVREPAKQSVTALTHQDDEFLQLDYSRALKRRPVALSRIPEVGAGGLVMGTAIHLVISRIDLAEPVTHVTIGQTIQRLVAEGAMTASMAERIDIGGIVAFFESEQGAMVLDKRNRIWREWPFTFGESVGQVGEIVVVQGIIDMLIERPDGLVVIDFKSDRVSDRDLNERAEGYRGQVELYAKAAGDILGLPVQGKWLYFLTPRRAVAL